MKLPAEQGPCLPCSLMGHVSHMAHSQRHPMGIIEGVSEDDGELPVTHAGHQTVVQSHADPRESSVAVVSVPLWASYSFIVSPMSSILLRQEAMACLIHRPKPRYGRRKEGSHGPRGWGVLEQRPRIADMLHTFDFPNSGKVCRWGFWP